MAGDPSDWTAAEDRPAVLRRKHDFLNGGESIPVGVDTLLAIVTIDTTGFSVGDARDPWDLKIGSTIAGSAALLETDQNPPIPLAITEGQITFVVPEPSTWAMVLIGLLGAAVLIWKFD